MCGKLVAERIEFIRGKLSDVRFKNIEIHQDDTMLFTIDYGPNEYFINFPSGGVTHCFVQSRQIGDNRTGPFNTAGSRWVEGILHGLKRNEAGEMVCK